MNNVYVKVIYNAPEGERGTVYLCNGGEEIMIYAPLDWNIARHRAKEMAELLRVNVRYFEEREVKRLELIEISEKGDKL